MGIITNVASVGALPTIEEQDKKRIVSLGDSGDWEVTDGDSLTNVETGQQLRVKGHQAPEVDHAIYDDGELKYKHGEVGGDYATDVLYEALKGGGFESVTDLKLQEVGGGAGKRFTGQIRNKDGQDINSFLLSKGLTEPSGFATQTDYDDYIAGKLRREIYGDEDGFGELREGRPTNGQDFKQTAINANVILDDPIYGDSFYSGIAFNKDGANEKGYAVNPLTTAFGVGWNNALADFGGALNALGELTESEWLQDKGDTISYVNSAKAENNPFLRIQSLSQLEKESDTMSEYLFNGAEWLGVNTAMSLPYLGLLATGVATGGVASALGAGALGVTAAATIPSAALHTGNIWNNVDVDKRNPTTASATIALGTAAGAIDILSLKGLSAINAIVKPSELLSKKGRAKAVGWIKDQKNAEIAKLYPNIAERSKHLYTTPKAWKLFNESVEESTTQFLKHGRNLTSASIQKQRGLQDVIAQLSLSSGSEATTEVLQELITYSTAKAINNEVSTPEDLFAQLADDLGDEDGELRDILLNAAAAGGAVGGVFSGVGVVKDKANRSKLAAYLDRADANKDLSPIQRAYYNNKGNDKNIQTSQKEYAERATTPREGDGKKKGFFGNLVKYADEDSAFKRLTEGRAGVVGETINQLQKTYKEELLRALPERAFESQAIRNIYSYVSGTRGTHAGQAFEKSGNRSNGILKNITNPRELGVDHNFNYKNENSTVNWSAKMYKYGQYVDGNEFTGQKATDPKDLTFKQLVDIGIFKETDNPSKQDVLKAIQKFEKSRHRFERRANMLHGATVTTLENNINDEKRIARAKDAKLKGWWWKHRDISKQSVQADPKGFQRIVVDAVNDIKTKRKLTEEEQIAYKDPYGFASALTDHYINDTPLAPEYTLGKGELDPNALHARTLSLSQRKGIDKFLDGNIFRTLDNTSQDTVRKITHINYFGENNSKLDLMFGDAREELLELGYPEHEVIEMLKKAAYGVDGIIDASSGNYKPIENKQLEGIQKGILTWTGFVGMSLSAPASIPEFMAIGTGLRDNAEFKKLAKTTGREFYKGLYRAVVNIPAKHITKSPQLEDDFYDLQQRIGIPQDNASLSKKFGTGEEVELGGRVEKLNDFFYWFIGLQGLTSVQRTVATSTGLDYIRDRAERLINVNLNGELNSQELDAYKALAEVGIDVEVLVSNLKKLNARKNRQPGQAIVNLTKDLSGSKDKEFDNVQRQVEIGLQAFVDTRIQNPGAANRPLLLQDPHFRLLTQFNGFISTVTTTLVPKLWNDEFGRAVRRRNPSMGIDAFAVIVTMVLLGGVGQWLKDLIKFGEASPYLDNEAKFVQRAFTSSGIFGQGEKLIELIAPLYEQKGEGIGQRVAETALGSVGRQVSNFGDLITPTESGGLTKKQETLNDALKFLPFTSNITSLRNEIVEK